MVTELIFLPLARVRHVQILLIFLPLARVRHVQILLFFESILN